MKEERIVNRIRNGDEQAIDAVMRRYARLLWSVSEGVLRGERNGEYARQVRELLSGSDGSVVFSVSPSLVPEDPVEDAVFDPGFASEPQRVLTGVHVQPVDWDFRLLATEGESAQILSVMLSLRDYPMPSGSYRSYTISSTRRRRQRMRPVFSCTGAS